MGEVHVTINFTCTIVLNLVVQIHNNYWQEYWHLYLSRSIIRIKPVVYFQLEVKIHGGPAIML